MRFSDNSIALLNSCPLKYELLRGHDLGDVQEYIPEDMETNPNLGYGQALGIGFQSLLKHKDLDRAIFDTYVSYPFWEDDKKCFEGLVAAMQQLYKEFPLDLFDLVLAEASIRLDLDGEDFWCGFIDGVLYRKDTKKYIILEAKSCGQNREDLTPLYQNSPQALGYSIILPELVGSEYDFDVMYIVAHVPGKQWFPNIKTYIFEKTRLHRLKWLLSLKLDYEQYCKYREMQVFPARGKNCLAWNRPCSLFGICDLLTPSEFPEREKDKIDLKADWNIHSTLDIITEKEINRKSEVD